mmetsp:Transcript_15598/g.24255  ORF Transcript_15598/g.24255 Transcript_15598/m.24255 type:complete len:150 (+) Transcript_15598:153-602(+)|eukprot:CAMPEP_0184295782 /NCGR_PEP_ID=MMETSP1049-20130417/6658_1 /TAXON_ID=77928 /ORGANISM="Proteomonas sulcata, Strain CCMP704" /LENGTH=149 /DNA_ID=CAMNT_0026604531 /DNA_START=147 /DNA_END=596 /DNA_ORIENTATION=-
MGADNSCCAKRHEPKMKERRLTEPDFDNDYGAQFRTIGKEDVNGNTGTAKIEAKSDKVGIGAYFQKSKTDPSGLSVKSLLSGSPAQTCNRIKVGDIIMSVDGMEVYGKKLAELAEVLLGPPGSPVTLKFKESKSGEVYDVTIQRGIPNL